eukprot:gb/GEZJ01006023.1/.p2 GENE.gb/GEZJ01006023.1/~~gb/GEZJ01006023.1/.p2  ORF type:complete len:121 (+),score=2.46 gb/GEZJ01006023.1/:334-696(+)
MSSNTLGHETAAIAPRRHSPSSPRAVRAMGSLAMLLSILLFLKFKRICYSFNSLRVRGHDIIRKCGFAAEGSRERFFRNAAERCCGTVQSCPMARSLGRQNRCVANLVICKGVENKLYFF